MCYQSFLIFFLSHLKSLSSLFVLFLSYLPSHSPHKLHFILDLFVVWLVHGGRALSMGLLRPLLRHHTTVLQNISMVPRPGFTNSLVYIPPLPICGVLLTRGLSPQAGISPILTSLPDTRAHFPAFGSIELSIQTANW